MTIDFKEKDFSSLWSSHKHVLGRRVFNPYNRRIRSLENNTKINLGFTKVNNSHNSRRVAHSCNPAFVDIRPPEQINTLSFTLIPNLIDWPYPHEGPEFDATILCNSQAHVNWVTNRHIRNLSRMEVHHNFCFKIIASKLPQVTSSILDQPKVAATLHVYNMSINAFFSLYANFLQRFNDNFSDFVSLSIGCESMFFSTTLWVIERFKVF